MPQYLCNKCFYVKETDECPDKCIVCGADSSEFTRVNYSLMKYIPAYWAEHIEEKIKTIHEKQILAGKKGMSFALITDVHWGPNLKHSAAILEKVMHRCAIPYAFNGGDTVSGAGLCPPSELFTELQNYSEMFRDLEPRILMAQGNHDPSYSLFDAPKYYVQNITKGEVHEYIYRYETKYPDRVMSEDGSYFYVDCPNYKMRLAVLNCFDVPNDDVNEDGTAKFNKMGIEGFRQEQLEWFANTVLNVPSPDWTVSICTHSNPACVSPCYNEDVLLGLIDAYRKGERFAITKENTIPEYNVQISADYTGRGGEFAIWVSGHTHIDLDTVKEGTLCTSTLCDWNHKPARLPFERPVGTVFEHGFDVFTIDPENHKIYVTVGAGEDRQFDYTPKSK